MATLVDDFKIDELIEKISKYVALHPGDIIATGTPAGVGAGLQPPQFLQPGDEVKVTIDNIGTLTTYISKIKSYTIFKKLKGSVVNMLLLSPNLLCL